MVDANGGYTVGQARRVGAALDDLRRRSGSKNRSAATTPRACARPATRAALRRRRRGVRRRPLRDPALLAGGGLPATRRHPLRRLHRLAGRLRGRAAHNLQVSAHCAPALHAPVAAAISNLRHIEWFADHVRLEPKLFDGLPQAANGTLALNTTRAGHGMTLAASADQYHRERWPAAF